MRHTLVTLIFFTSYSLLLNERPVFAEKFTDKSPETPHKLTVNVGETIEINLPPEPTIKISRRGLFDLVSTHQDTWQLTGLRPGLAVLEAQGDDDHYNTSSKGRRFYIEVQKPAVSKSSPPWSSRSPFIWLCQRPGIRCLDDFNRIEGVTDDAWTYLAAKEACRGSKHCEFALKMSDSTYMTWHSDIAARLGPLYTLTPSFGDGLLAEASCATESREQLHKWANQMSGKLIDREHLVFRCKEERWEGQSYQLAARVFWLDESAAEQLGFAHHALLRAAMPPPLTELELSTSLRSLKAGHQAEILGEPVFRIRHGESAEMLAGGEFQVFDYETAKKTPDHVQTTSRWKEHGLRLGFELTTIDMNSLQLKLDLSLKSRADSSSGSLRAHALKSTLTLALNHPTLIGMIDLVADGQSHQELPWAAHVPIIGPLFRLRGTEHGRSRLYVWLHARRDDDTRHDLQAVWPESIKNPDANHRP